MSHRLVPILIALLLGPASCGANGPRFVVEAPRVVLDGIPVAKVVVTATGANPIEPVSIEGLELRREGEPVEWPPFEDGRLELTTDPATRTKLFVTGDVVVGSGPDEVRSEVTAVPGWLSLLPPLVAVGLAIWLRQVFTALLAGIVVGALVLALGHPIDAVDTLLVELLAKPLVDASHVQVILFTTFLGSMVAVMFKSGGTHALVATDAAVAEAPASGTQLGTARRSASIVFFDDYANTLLVGTTMRPVTDGQRISRAKLAFLVDATAAPIAGLAIDLHVGRVRGLA